MNSAQRQPASTALWAHLLRKDVVNLPSSDAPPSSSASFTPVAPIDKNGASMRILLLDTSHNLEKFSTRVDQLTSGVDQAKAEVKSLYNAFRKEHEEIINTIVDLVNRCQTEVQKSLGTPAQENQVEDLRKHFLTIDRRLDAVDKRLDMLHTLQQLHNDSLQAQTKALQSQAEAFQSIQSQQHNMMSMLSPLLPLLQAVPLHIETARNSIADSLQHMSWANESLKRGQSAHNSNSTPKLSRPLLEELSSSTPLSAEPRSSSPTRKRPRIDAGPDATHSRSTGVGVLSRRKTSLILPERPRRRESALDSPRRMEQNISPTDQRLQTIQSTPGHPKQLSLRASSNYKVTAPHTAKDLRLPSRESISSFPSKEPVKRKTSANGPNGGGSRTGLFTVDSDSLQATTKNDGKIAPSRFYNMHSVSPIGGPSTGRQLGSSEATPMPEGRISGSSISKPFTSAAQAHGRREESSTRFSPLDSRASRQRLGITRAVSHWQVEGSARYSLHAQSSNLSAFVPPSNVASKPMSIRDRKANQAQAQGISRKEGKRFIPLGEDEDEDDEFA